MSKYFLTTAGAALLALAASACSTAFNGAPDAVSVAERHPIAVDAQVVTMELDGGSGQLSEMDRARISAFTDVYFTRGHGPVTVTAPATGTGYKPAEQVAADARAALNAAGVSWADITGASYQASAESGGRVVLSFTRYVATPSPCGDWSDNWMSMQKNMMSKNFGCATQNNLAAMVADPHDLVAPADMTPADAQSRVFDMQQYRAGADPTASENQDLDKSTTQN